MTVGLWEVPWESRRSASRLAVASKLGVQCRHLLVFQTPPLHDSDQRRPGQTRIHVSVEGGRGSLQQTVLLESTLAGRGLLSLALVTDSADRGVLVAVDPSLWRDRRMALGSDACTLP